VQALTYGASGITGKVEKFGQPAARVDSSFSDIVSDVDLTFMGAIEARFERFSLVDVHGGFGTGEPAIWPTE